jgi:hypothetical protein
MSESELLYNWRFTTSQFVFATSPLRLTTSNFIFQLNTCGYSPYVTSSLTKGCVCRLQLLPVLASAVILRSESRGTHDHILLSQIRDIPTLEGQVLVFISPRSTVARLCLQALGSLSVASYDSQGYASLNTGGNMMWLVLQCIYIRICIDDKGVQVCRNAKIAVVYTSPTLLISWSTGFLIHQAIQ